MEKVLELIGAAIMIVLIFGVLIAGGERLHCQNPEGLRWVQFEEECVL